MRCHDQGMKGFTDNVRPALERLPGNPGFDTRQALQLYVPDKEMQDLVQEDKERFQRAMKRILAKAPPREPLIPVSQRYLDEPLHLTTAAGELGLPSTTGLTEVFRLRGFTALGLLPLSAEGVVRRDAWEDYNDQVVSLLNLGRPIVALDGLMRRDFPAGAVPYEVELKTNRKGNVFEPGDKMVIFVKNNSSKDLYIELVGTSTKGRKVILAQGTTLVKAGETYRYPREGAIVMKGQLGKEQINLLASPRELPAAVLLRGETVSDRVVHPFYQVDMKGKRPRLLYDPGPIVKKTIDIETR
jgi:serine/threonine-protein kinase